MIYVCPLNFPLELTSPLNKEAFLPLPSSKKRMIKKIETLLFTIYQQNEKQLSSKIKSARTQ